MSYGFEEPHTLVLPRTPRDLRNPRKRTTQNRQPRSRSCQGAPGALVWNGKASLPMANASEH